MSMRLKAILIVILFLISFNVNADEPSGGGMGNLGPTIQGFNVYTDIGIVLNASMNDSNSGYDINYARIDVHENESLDSPILCYFETPTNLSLTVGGVNLEMAYIFERLTPYEAQNITSGLHIYFLNVSDDNGLYDTANYTHNLSGEPHFINLNVGGTSYIHVDNENPGLDDTVTFTLYIIDFNTPPENITAKFYYSTDNRDTWDFINMSYDPILEVWYITQGPFIIETEMFYYVIVDDGTETNRTPATWDILEWLEGAITVQQTITLYRGWNLLSINLETTHTTQDLLANLYITSVIRFLPRTKVWDIAINSGGNDFDLDYEWGYYVYSSKTQNIPLPGQVVVNGSLTLYRDWNLYGVSNTISAKETTINTSISQITARSYYGKYTTYRPGYSPSYSLFKEYGYFLFSNEERGWEP